MSERVDEWAALDELLGVEVDPVPDEGDRTGRVLRALLDRGQPGSRDVPRLADRQRPEVRRAARRQRRHRVLRLGPVPFGAVGAAARGPAAAGGIERPRPRLERSRRRRGHPLLVRKPVLAHRTAVRGLRCRPLGARARRQIRQPEPLAQDADERPRRDERVRAPARPGTRPRGHGRPGRQRGTAPGWPRALRLLGGRQRAAPESAEGGRGLPAAGSGARRARRRDRPPDLRRVPQRLRGPRDRDRTQPRRHPVAPLPDAGTRTGTGTPTDGRAASSARSSRIRTTRATRSSVGGESTRPCSIPRTSPPGTSSAFVGRAPIASSVHGNRPTRRSCPLRTSPRRSCSGAREVRGDYRRGHSWSEDRSGPSARTRCGDGCGVLSATAVSKAPRGRIGPTTGVRRARSLPAPRSSPITRRTSTCPSTPCSRR